MKFTDRIEDIDFDGAEIKSITRARDDIYVILDNCILFTRHPKSSEFIGKINGLSITFFGITNEISLKYTGIGISELYSGALPLETVEILTVRDQLYEFGGYVDGEPWYQWSFNAKSYEGSLQSS
jgi:hypothetical protein